MMPSKELIAERPTGNFEVKFPRFRVWILARLKTLPVTYDESNHMLPHTNRSRRLEGGLSSASRPVLPSQLLCLAITGVFFGASPALLSQEDESAPIFRRNPQMETPAEPTTTTPAVRPRVIAPGEGSSTTLEPQQGETVRAVPLMPRDPAPSPESTVRMPNLLPGNVQTATIVTPEGEPEGEASPQMPPTELPPKPAVPDPVLVQPPTPAPPKKTGPGFQAGLQTIKGARILTLSIPGPRGQIVDRWGAPLAQNRVVYYLGFNFPYMEGKGDAEKISYARNLLNRVNEALTKDWDLKDSDILEHYKDRRWLPLIFANRPLTEAEIAIVRDLDAPGLILHPTYQRVYPQGEVAGHMVGYVGKRAPWPKGEVPDGEEMWPVAQGVQGLEKAFESALTGRPGRVQIIFNEQGERVEETVVNDPVPGYNIVTSIDLEMQRLAERILSEKVKRGAFVIMDVRNGDVLALASFPNHDPNEFIPRISTEVFASLRDDPAKPLLGRAFQGVYPPASTFKVTSALSLLESGTVNEYSLYSCPTSFTLGDRVAHNWNKEDEGIMNVVGALARSCNTWFYQAALDSNASSVTMMGQKLGYGRKTGIPLREEQSGFMPTNEWSRTRFGHTILGGDLMNIVIGQGSVEATPLQVAQAFAAVGNRQFLMKSRLVLQLQDFSNRIVDAYDVERRNLNISQYSLGVVHKGMYEVVNGGRGTGRNAGHPRINVSGKTGTGQWKPAQKQNVAWFAGFAPSEYPVYSFAVVYEGDPGEKVGGGSKAAPVVGEFFKEYLTDQKLAELQDVSREIKVRLKEEMIDIGPLEGGTIYQGGSGASGTDTAPPPAKKKKKSGGGFFKNIFGSAG